MVLMGGGGGGGEAGGQSISHIGMRPPQRVGFLRRFGLKTGIDCPFWSGIGYCFKGTKGVYERIYCFNSK